jgi:phosphate transport system substrate-binding protein
MNARRALSTIALATAILVTMSVPASAVSPAKINGTGSSYVALAIQQWVADGQSRGLPVNFLPTSSPDGLTSYADGLIDFAATEAEYSALVGPNVGSPAGARGYQYVPDVAGATAIMYNVQDRAGRHVNYLHLSMRTTAKIFMGYISNWSDPAISADNKGLKLPDQPITVVYRSGLSGTTGSFYDFVAHAAPDLFGPWAAKYHLPTAVRIIQLDGTPDFAPKTIAFGGSDQVVQYIASSQGQWSIGYDEFGYAKVYNADTAWVQNASGNWVQPYAQNISAALESAKLRPDLSQELSGVYASTNPLAYPISSYSYLVTQCAKAGDRPTCQGDYSNRGIDETLARWMQYIECDGQVSMARIGYSPLPPNLSQEMSNSIARMQGTQPAQLNAANCANPRFHGSLGTGATSPQDPLANVPQIGDPGDGSGSGTGSGTGTGTGNTSGGSSLTGGSGATTPTGAGGAGAKVKATKQAAAAAKRAAAARKGAAAVGRAGGATQSVAGGSDEYRNAAPIAYDRPGVPNPSSAPAWVLAALLVAPPVVAFVWFAMYRRRRDARAKRATTLPTSP